MAKIEKIFIAENSEIVSNGVIQILNNYDNSIKIETSVINNALLSDIKRSSPDILLLNPITLSSIGKDYFIQISDFCRANRIPLIGIVYSYFDNDIIKLFDNVITINDSSEAILDKIKETKREDVEDSSNANISKREEEVIRYIALGLSNKEIAESMSISAHTVISHRKNITHKLGVKSTSAITIYAVVNNIINTEDFKKSI